MEQNKRLTRARCNGIKIGYWSMARKDELVQRLGKYEDICEDPDELRQQIAELEHRIDELIDPQAALGLDMHSFYFYILPLNDADAEKAQIMDRVMNGGGRP